MLLVSGDSSHLEPHLSLGVSALLLGSFLSGLSSSLSERALQSRSSLLFSAELAMYGVLYMVVSLGLGVNPDAHEILNHGIFSGW